MYKLICATLTEYSKLWQPRQCIKKQRYHFANKVHIVKAIVFPLVMYRCETWTIKKTEHWKIDAFELWCWRRLLRSLGQQGDQTSHFWIKSTLNIHWKDWCWSSISNTLATWCEEPTHWKRPWSWERLRAGGEGADRGWDGCMAWHSEEEFEQTPGDSEGQGSLAFCSPWGHKESDTTEQLNNNNSNNRN